MKVYYKNQDQPPFRYPKDMEIIISYLEAHGTLKVQPSTVERLYEEFCDEKCSASWLNVCEDYLEEFADWLSEIDL